MPFKSQAQRSYLFARIPDVAARYAAETTAKQEKSLPKRVKKDKDKK